MRVLLIYNPSAAHGRARNDLETVQAAARSHGIEVELAVTTGPGHATALARTTDLRRFYGVVAAGGDGTVFEVLNGYLENDVEDRPPFGVLPVGTGNAFARDLPLRTGDIEGAMRLIGRGHTRPADVGRMEHPGGVHHYLNILGLGFVTEVTRKAHGLKRLGNISYTVGVLWQTAALSASALSIRVDGRELEREAIFVEISNTRYTSNFLMAPQASINDGLLDVVILNRVSRRRLLSAFPTIFKGTHIELDEVEHYTARHIEIRSTSPMPLSPDGELLGTTPVVVECLPGKLEVFSD